MSNNLPGNPHVYEGPQISPADSINEQFIAEEGITAETMFLSELARNTESNLAVAFEIRTQTLLQANLHNRVELARIHGGNLEDVPDEVLELIHKQGEKIDERLGGEL